MHGDRISTALARIETAAHRIKEAAREQHASADAEGAIGRKYEALRQEASTALSELDQLIAHLER